MQYHTKALTLQTNGKTEILLLKNLLVLNSNFLLFTRHNNIHNEKKFICDACRLCISI